MRRFLIWFPIIFIVLLLQTYFWVPTYEEQTRGNPTRINQYIDASIGDAQILNPILSSDSASSDIENKVFEGLLDRNENLELRGRLATNWEIYEEAYFYINDRSALPGQPDANPQRVVEALRQAVEHPERFSAPVGATLARISKIDQLPARSFQIFKTENEVEGNTKKVRIQISAPSKIRLRLSEVDQDLFSHLEAVLGENYFDGFDARRFMRIEPQPDADRISAYAAELLPVTEHNPVIVFHLRPNVKFHDGHVVDAHDVQFTYEAIMNPSNLSPRTADYEPVKAVEVVDPLTVRIVYKRLFSPALATWAMGILPSHLMDAPALRREALNRDLDPENFTLRQSRLNRNPIGCGPFQFVEWQSDQYIQLNRFEDYWEGAPNFLNYIYRVIPDLFTQEMEFYAGTIDNYAVQPHQVDRLKDNPKYQSFSGLSFSYAYIGYNMRREPFNDVRVRKALTMAIDIDSIIEYVLYDQAERITGPFLKQTDFYNESVRPLPYNPQKALDLLAEAGWHKGPQGWLEKDGKRLQFTLITNQGNDIRKAILSIAQNSWRKIGIDVRTDVLEWAVFIQERANKLDFDALVLGWVMGIEPDLFQIWHSSQTNPNQLNFVGFENAEADDLIIRIRQEYNPQQQERLCHRLHKIIAEEQPYSFLYVSKWTAVLDKRLVILATDEQGNRVYEKIKPTKTGDYKFYFNEWVKLPAAPQFEME